MSEAKSDTKTAEPIVPEIDVQVREETALVRQLADEDRSMLDRMAVVENALQMWERRTELLTNCRRAAIRQTNPTDWVLFKDRDGNVFSLLADSGAQKVAEIYGVQVTNIRPQKDGIFSPQRQVHDLQGDDGRSVRVVELRAWCDAFCAFNGRHMTFEASKRDSEDFTGRKVDGAGRIVHDAEASALEADLRQALYTSLRSKAIRVLTGLARVPSEELQEAWSGTNKTLDGCRKGHGFGSTTQRDASKVASEDVRAAAKKLGEEILRRVGGDKEAARSLLKEVTSGKSKSGKVFHGFDSIERLTLDWQVENAWTKLRDHDTFGDSAREPGQD